jgi:hypothetical protein
MQFEGKRLRDSPLFLDLLQIELCLPRALHFTTIKKLRHKIKQTWLELFIARKVVTNKASSVAIDGTGFSKTNSRYHFTNKKFKKPFLNQHLLKLYSSYK